jgi:Dolichyl-phosphate-mannose-protein mannosyltransferase
MHDDVSRNGDNRLEKSRDLLKKRDWIQPLSLIAVPLYLYLNLFTFTNVPFLLGGDQTFFWIYAVRLLHGEKVYRDFFQFTPPGADLFYLALFRLFGPHIWVTNFAVLLLGVALCWVCFLLAQRLMERNLAFLASLLFLVFVYGDRLDATHHWFSVLAGLCAVRVVMPERTLPRIAIAGVLLGVASFFTQTTGVAGLLAVIASLAWEHASSERPWRIILKQQLFLCIAFGLAWSVLSVYFIAHTGWRQLWYLQVTYPQRYVVSRHGLFFPEFQGPLTRHVLLEQAQRLLLYVLLIVIYPPVLWYSRRRHREPASQNKMQLVLLSLVGLSFLLEIITRVNWNRIYIVSMPAIILLLWGVARLGRLRSHATAAIWVVIACVAAKQIMSRQRPPHRIALLPAGKAIVSAESDEKFYWLMQHTSPGDLFFQAQWSDLYPTFTLELRSPVFVDDLRPNEATRPEYVELTVRQVEQQHVKYILWSPRLVSLDVPHRYGQDHLDPFRVFLSSHYRRVHVFSDRDEIWERR